MSKMKYYEVVLIDKNGEEHFYIVFLLMELVKIISFAMTHNQEVKYVKGKVRK